MNIQAFMNKHTTKPQPIEKLVKKWVCEKRVTDFLNTSVMEGVLVVDLFCCEGLLDQLPSEVQDGFAELMQEKADTPLEIKRLIIERFEKSEESINGLINKIQGQIGENEFVKQMGSAAALADSGSQEGFDVVINAAGGKKYFQVKIYDDANGVMSHIEKTQKKIDASEITYNNEAVTKIDFAVNSDIYEEVSNKVAEKGFDVEILDIGTSREEIRSLLNEAVDNVARAKLDNFFEELFEGVVAVASIHAAVNGFLVWKKAKSWEMALSDTTFMSLSSASGIMAAITVETAVTEVATLAAFIELEIAVALLGPVGVVASLGTGIVSRNVIKRFTDRRFIMKQLGESHRHLNALCLKFEGA